MARASQITALWLFVYDVPEVQLVAEGFQIGPHEASNFDSVSGLMQLASLATLLAIQY